MASEVDERPWQFNTQSIEGGLMYICENMLFEDLYFIIGPNKKEFNAHRLFVAAKSPELWNIITKGADVLPPMSKIYLPDVSENAFEVLLKYIYTSVIKMMDSQDLVLDVYQAAITYGLKKLQEECENYIKEWDINCENVIDTLQMSDLQFIQDRCWQFLELYAKTVLQSEGIKAALSITLVRIFEKGYFTGIPTKELLTKIVDWADNHSKVEKNNENKKKSYKTVRNQLLIPHGETSKCLMSWIGFQNLTPKELSEVCSEYPELLTDEEFRILIVYACAEGEKPTLPKWA